MGSSATQKAAASIIEWGLSNGKVTGNRPKATDIFGSLTFGDEAQRRRLPRDVYRALRRTIDARRAARRVGRPTSSPPR